MKPRWMSTNSRWLSMRRAGHNRACDRGSRSIRLADGRGTCAADGAGCRRVRGPEQAAIPSTAEPSQPRDRNGAIAADAALAAADAREPVTTALTAQARKALADDGDPTSEGSLADDGGEAAVDGPASDANAAGAATSEDSQSSDQPATTATAPGVIDGEPASVDDKDPAAIGPQGDLAPTIIAAAADPTGSPAGAGGDATPIEHAADDSAAPSAPVASDAQPATTGAAAPLARLASGRTLHAATAARRGG